MTTSPIQTTDLFVVERDNVTYKVTAEDLGNLTPKEITPTVDEITFSPPIPGTGTEADPFVLTPVEVVFGTTGYSTESITFTDQKEGNFVVFTDVNAGANGQRYEQLSGTITSDDTYTTNLQFVDAPANTSTTTYTGKLRITSTDIYISWEVTVKPATSEPDINTVTLTEDATGGNRFEDQSFTTSISMTDDGEPLSNKYYSYKVQGNIYIDAETSVITDATSSSNTAQLYFADDTDIALFEVGDQVVQDSGGQPITADRTNKTLDDNRWVTCGSTTTKSPQSLSYGNGRFVVSGGTPGGKLFAYSADDGDTWVKCNTDGLNTGEIYNDTTYGYSNKWVAVQQTGSNRIVYSDDNASSWQPTPNNPLTSRSWVGVTYGKNKYVALAVDGSIGYSSDAINWNVSGENLSNFKSIQFVGNYFFAFNYNNTIRYSSNGTSWSNGSAPSSGDWSGPIAYGGSGRYVMVGRTSGGRAAIAYSSGPTSAWTIKELRSENRFWKDIAYGDGKFVVITEENYNAPYDEWRASAYSTNGIDWTYQPLVRPWTSGKRWLFLAYGAGLFMIKSIDEDYARSRGGDSIVSITLTFANDTNLDNFRVGDGVSEGGSVLGYITSIGSTSITYTPDYSGAIDINPDRLYGPTFAAATGTVQNVNVGSKQINLGNVTSRFLKTEPGYDSNRKLNKTVGTTRTDENATVWLNTDSNRRVTGTSNAPTYYSTTSTTDSVSFTLSTSSGLTWDQEFLPGATIQASVYAQNEIGRSPASGTTTSNVVQPGGTRSIPDSMTEAELKSQKLLFTTREYRLEKHTQDCIACVDDLRDSFLADGYSREEVNSALIAETPVAIDGYYPLYTTEASANAAGDGSSHTHTVDGVAYYMPDSGVTIYHGNYSG